MKIVCVLGSPRPEGNSAAIARHFAELGRQRGAETEFFLLNRLSYQGCQGCNACKTGREDCIIRDDLTDVLAAVCRSDILVLASPVWFGDVSGQLKCFIDRTFSLLKPDFPANPRPSRLAAGKRLLFILTQGQSNPVPVFDLFSRYKKHFRCFGFAEQRLISTCGMQKSGDALADPDVMRQVEDAVRDMVE